MFTANHMSSIFALHLTVEFNKCVTWWATFELLVRFSRFTLSDLHSRERKSGNCCRLQGTSIWLMSVALAGWLESTAWLSSLKSLLMLLSRWKPSRTILIGIGTVLRLKMQMDCFTEQCRFNSLYVWYSFASVRSHKTIDKTASISNNWHRCFCLKSDLVVLYVAKNAWRIVRVTR